MDNLIEPPLFSWAYYILTSSYRGKTLPKIVFKGALTNI